MHSSAPLGFIPNQFNYAPLLLPIHTADHVLYDVSHFHGLVLLGRRRADFALKETRAPTHPCAAMEAVFNVADDFLLHPENFAVSNEQNGEKATKAAETLFAHGSYCVGLVASLIFFLVAKQTERKKTGALNTLLVDGFDSEQIWEQLQLLNIPALKHIDSAVNQLIKAKDLHFNLKEIDEEPKRKKTKVTKLHLCPSDAV